MKRIAFGLAVALLLPAIAFAQAKSGAQRLVLEFVDGSELAVKLADKSVLTFGSGILEGDNIPAGATVVTGPTTFAELKLSPNGTIIKLAKSTSFTVGAVAATPQDKNAFSVLAGKVRTVAAKGAQYQFNSQTAVAGVRGTDFTFNVEEGAKALLMVSKGQVDFAKIDAAGNAVATIPVGAGMAADAFGAAFQAFKFSADQFQQEFGDVGFKKLVESEVPQALEPAPTDKKDEAKEAAKAAADSPLMKWLRDVLGFEIGSVTINGQGYSKAVLAPEFNMGKLKLGLYLPVIYTSDLFNPHTWYHPAGNDEWSFGREYWAKDPVKGAGDFARDLALKIKYFSYGQPLDDPFFIKVGNLQDMTIGHGLVMRNYQNNTEFPSVRRVGFNTGIDAGGFGFEALVNDLADPSIYGARLYLRPIENFKLAIGVSGVVDTKPGADLSDAATQVGDMMLIGTGVDLDLPIIPRNPILGIRAFADVAATLPYVQKEFVTGSTLVPVGPATSLIYKDGKFSNYGFASGFIGNVLFIDWRLEYRYFTGVFRPSFFDSTYNLKRSEYALQYASYLDLNNPITNTPTVMGIYGEGGFNVLKDKLVFTLGYMWPWSPDATSSAQKLLSENADEFHAKLVIKKGLIPIVDVAGAIAYDRRSLLKPLMDGNFKFIDENTTFSGEIAMPVPKAPNLDLAVIFAAVPVRDTAGDIVYESNGTSPRMKPSITIETRVHL